MGYPIEVALRYLGTKRRAFISVGTAFAILGVALGVAALATVMSVTGGFQQQFREKVLGVNAHVLVLKYSTDFREYREIMDQVAKVPGVIGVAPFSINPMMLTHGDATATGVLLKGVDPAASLGVDAPPGVQPVLDLPKHIIDGDFKGLRLPGAKPAQRTGSPNLPAVPTLGSSGRKRAQTPADPSALKDASAPVELPATPELDDAGRNMSLLRAIEQDIRKRDEAAARSADAGADEPASPVEPAPDAGNAETAPDAGPVDAELDAGQAQPEPQLDAGSVEPDGGYASVLPETDELPPEVDPDLCADPIQVAKMPGIVIGVSLAKTLNLGVGQCLTVTSPTIGFSFSGGSVKPPVAKRFRVIAVFEAGFDQYDSKLVYTDLYEAQAFYDQGDTVTGVEMKVDDIEKAAAISRDIGQMLGNGLYHTMDWEELNHGLFTALAIQQIGMSFVLGLIILVASFTVIATLIMVVLDKKKEIAVMKAMGATDGAILRIFLYQGSIIGLVGTTLGLLLGLAVCKGLLVYGFPLDPKVYFISRLPVQARWQEFVITGQCALAICADATLLPSLYAAKLNPADAFRDSLGSAGRRLGWPLTLLLSFHHVLTVMMAVYLLVVLETSSRVVPWAWWWLVVACVVCIASALSTIALLLWKRWGLYVWCAGIVLGAPLVIRYLVLLLLFGKLGWFGWVQWGACLLVFGVYLAGTWGLLRRWRYFE